MLFMPHKHQWRVASLSSRQPFARIQDYLANLKEQFTVGVTVQWRIQGRGLGDRASPLFLDQTEAQKAEKCFGGDPPPSI